MRRFPISNFQFPIAVRCRRSPSPRVGRGGWGVRARQRGISFLEVLGAFMILAFVTLATVKLYRVGDGQQRTARNYTNAQVNNREAVRRILRTLRHGYAIQ